MRRVLILAVVLATQPAAWNVARACGDKFFMVGRGDRFNRAYASLIPGTVLMYTHGAAAENKGVRNAQLQKNIQRAGHRVIVVGSPAELGQALRSGSVDIVVAVAPQAVAMASDAAEAPSKPTVLAVAAGNAQAAPTAKSVVCRLKDSDKTGRFLTEIEETMKARVAAGLPAHRN